MDLSDRQQRIVGTAVTLLGVVVILAAVAGLVWVVGWFLGKFSHVFLPLVVAGVAALVFQPYFDWLRRRLKLPPVLALVALLLSVILPLAAFATFFGVVLAEQLSDLFARLPDWWQHVVVQLKSRWPAVVRFLDENPVGQRLRQAAEGQGGALLDGLQFFGGRAWSAGAGILRGVATALNWAVTPVYFAFFMLAERKDPTRIGQYLPFLKDETREHVVFLVREFVGIVVAFFRGQLTIAFLQGVLFAIGFALAGLQYGLVLGLALGFLNIVPYLGSMVGLGVALPLAYFQTGGGWWLVGAVVAVFATVQMIEGYVLTPKIMGDRTGLHPMAIIVAVFFWGSALNGILGMILAIPLTAFLVVFWRLAREKYIDAWV